MVNRKLLGCILCMMLPVLLMMCAGGSKLKKKAHAVFDVEAYETQKLAHACYYLEMSNWEQLRDHGDDIKKVVISEFNVEFPFYFNGNIKDAKPHYRFAEMAYQQFTEELAALTGWEFVTREQLKELAAYQALNHIEVGYLIGPHHNDRLQDHFDKTLIIPAKHLKISSATRRSNQGDQPALAFEKANLPIESRLLKESGADALMKVHLQVRLMQSHSKIDGKKYRKCVIFPSHIPMIQRGPEIKLAFGPQDQGFSSGWITTTMQRDPKNKDRNHIMATTPVNEYRKKREYLGLKPDSFEEGFKFCLHYFTGMYGALVNSMIAK